MSTDPAATTLPLACLRPSALNPRRTGNAAADLELLASIKNHGILTPLLVRAMHYATDAAPVYEIVAGHRRYAAATELGLDRVPVHVRLLTDDDARDAAVVENLQREDLAPLDEAHAYAALLTRRDGARMTPAIVAAAVGKSPAYVGRRLKLLDLVGAAVVALAEGRMTVAHAELLAKLTEGDQVRALDEAVWTAGFDYDDVADGESAAHLTPLAALRAWITHQTKLQVTDALAQAEFPELAAALEAVVAGAPLLLEVALDLYGGAHHVPPGVLKPEKDYRLVDGKPCAHTARAVVVWGSRRGDVVQVCPSKSCARHWPSPAKRTPVKPGTPAVSARDTWEETEKRRRHQQRAWERIYPDAVKALVAATAKIKTTPKLLASIIASHADDAEHAIVRTAVGTITLETFGRAYTLADAVHMFYGPDAAAETLKGLGSRFDMDAAMAAALAAMAKEEAAQAPVAAAAKKTAKKTAAPPTKKGRAS